MWKKKPKPPKVVPPDGGWGYMICVGFTVIYAAYTSPTNSFGVIFNDLIENSNEGASVVAGVQGICGLMISLSGLIVDINLKWFTLRQLCYFGALLYTTSWLADLLIVKTSHLLITNGFLNGFGTGILNVCGYAIFNSYFEKKRVMMMSICLSAVGTISIVFPFIVEYCIESYGFTGMIAFMGAFAMHTFVGVTLYQPVEWHGVEIKETNERRDENYELNNLDLPFGEEQLKLLNEKRNDILINSEDIPRGRKLIKHSIWKKIATRFNLRLFRKFKFWNVALAMSLGILSDILFCTLLPLLLYEYNLSTHEITKCTSVISMADLISRILLGIVSKYVKVSSCKVYYASMLLTTVARFAFLQFTTYTEVFIILAILGALRALIYVPYSILCAEALPEENYVTAFGLAAIVNAVFNVIFPPIIGLAKDLSGSYTSVFYVFAFSNLISVIPWTVEFAMNYISARKTEIKTNLNRDTCLSTINSTKTEPQIKQ